MSQDAPKRAQDAQNTASAGEVAKRAGQTHPAVEIASQSDADPPADRAPGAPGGETHSTHGHVFGFDEHYRYVCKCGARLETRVVPPAPPSADAGDFEAALAKHTADNKMLRWTPPPDTSFRAGWDAAQQQHAAEVVRLERRAIKWRQRAELAEANTERLTADMQAAQRRAGALDAVLRDMVEPQASLEGRSKLGLLADWLDVLDSRAEEAGNEAQHDIRRWEQTIRAALATPPTPTGDSITLSGPRTVQRVPHSDNNPAGWPTGDPAAAQEPA